MWDSGHYGAGDWRRWGQRLWWQSWVSLSVTQDPHLAVFGSWSFPCSPEPLVQTAAVRGLWGL